MTEPKLAAASGVQPDTRTLVTRAIHALKTPTVAGSEHYRSGWEDGLDAAIDTARDCLEAQAGVQPDTRPEPDCLFCQPGTDGNRVVAENSSAYVRLDNFPAADGHMEVVPKRHVESFFDLTSAELDDVYTLACDARAHVPDPDGWTVGVNEGRAAGRTVDHLHIHLIPRRHGDVPDPTGGVRWVLPDTAALPAADDWDVPDARPGTTDYTRQQSAPARPVPDTARRERYAAALREHGMVHLGDQTPADEYDCCADAAVAVADEEQRDLRAEMERRTLMLQGSRDVVARLRAELEKARATTLTEAADFVGNDDDCDCGGCDTCIPRKLAAELRRMAAAGSGGQAEASDVEPPEHSWRVETYDDTAEYWAPGMRHTDIAEAAEYLARLNVTRPKWAVDGVPVKRRLVRATTTYTVEPGGQAEDGAQPATAHVVAEEQGAPVDWQAIVQQRERELKTVGEARHQAETRVAKVRVWVEADVVTGRNEFGSGYREAQRDIRDLLDGRPNPADVDGAQQK